MKKAFSKIFLTNIIYSILIIALGVVLFVWPEDTRNILCRVIGGVLVAVGLGFIISFFVQKAAFHVSANLALGVIIGVIGGFVFAQPQKFTDMLVIIAGVFIAISGLLNVGETISLATHRYGKWWVALLLAVLTLVFAALVIVKPGFIAKVIFQVAGAFLVYDGASNFWIATRLHKYARDAEAEANAVDMPVAAEAAVPVAETGHVNPPGAKFDTETGEPL